jgi:hypothetical protein
MKSDQIWEDLNRATPNYLGRACLAAVLGGFLLAAGIYAMTSWSWTSPIVVAAWIALVFGIRRMFRSHRPQQSEAEKRANREMSRATLILYSSLVLGSFVVSLFGEKPPLVVLSLAVAGIVVAGVNYRRTKTRFRHSLRKASAPAGERTWAHRIAVDVESNGSKSYWCEGCNFQTRQRNTAAQHAGFASPEETEPAY